MTIHELLQWGEAALKEHNVPNASGDAGWLLGHVLNKDRSGLVLAGAEDAGPQAEEAYRQLVARRAEREPLQYIIGTQEFMGLTFQVDPRVLIPRQDTEPMTEAAIEAVRENGYRSVLDLCTGSGAIGLSIGKLAEGTEITCADVSAGALAVAQENARLLGVPARFVCGDLLEPFEPEQRFDMIVCNPPYVRKDDIPFLQKEIRDHEPVLALAAGLDGLDVYRRLIPQLGNHLNPGGMVLLEIGDDQSVDVLDLMHGDGHFCEILCEKDLAGRDRYITAVYA